MADPLQWKAGEGYDIHVLRKGPASKVLDSSFEIDPQFPLAQFPLLYTPHFRGAPNAHGVRVNTSTGTVTALAHPSAAQPKLRNFLMTVEQDITSQGITFETKVRIHVHDSVQKIWLTPATLTVHTHADESQFTVLALFDDGSVGDITDWPQLTYKSGDLTAVTLLPGGIMVAEPGRSEEEMEVDITVTLKLTVPATNLSAVSKVATRKNWRTTGRDAPVKFVDGPLVPNEKDPGSTKRDSVASVVSARTNILFISEGFTQAQEKDFQQAVEDIVKTGLNLAILEPFKLLKGSINYWSVFVRSQEDGISLLGEHEVMGASPKQTALPLPRPEKPDPSATSWSVANMIHEIGLPVPQDPQQDVDAWVAQWKKLYTVPVTDALVTAALSDWNDLRTRTPLNERDSVFGMAHGARPRVSDESGSGGGADPMLRNTPRRPSDASIDVFIEKLNYGIPIPGGDPHNIGETWTKTQKDQGLVCFICLSDVAAGEARPRYFTASTGYERLATLVAATHGLDIKTAALSDPAAPYSKEILASRVAHECGHALSLGDEYGPGSTANFVLGSPTPIYPNLQTKDAITSIHPTSGATVYDPTLIKWLFPRVLKIGLMERAPDPQGGSSFKMRMVAGHGKPFKKDDIVQMRQPPLRRSDPFADLRFKVDQVWPDSVDVTQQLGQPLDVTLFDPNRAQVLICVSLVPGGVEVKVIADPVLNHIRTSGGPLNAPAANPAAACQTANNAVSVMTPTNLPVLNFKKRPAAMADVIGIYEGGGHYDCGIFRPAGRCKMRSGDDKVIPFCHICRYILVDRVDPMKLAALDKMYAPHYPF